MYQTPYSIIGSNGTCPDNFVIQIIGRICLKPDGHRPEHLHDPIFTCTREEGETDTDFWDRTMDRVSGLLTPMYGETPTGHMVIMTCMYEQSDFDTTPAFPKGKRK